MLVTCHWLLLASLTLSECAVFWRVVLEETPRNRTKFVFANCICALGSSAEPLSCRKANTHIGRLSGRGGIGLAGRTV